MDESNQTLETQTPKTLKIKSVDKTKFKENYQKIAPIVLSGLGLGLTAYLMHTGVIDYDKLVDLKQAGAEIGAKMASFIPFQAGKDYVEGIERLVFGTADKVGLNNLILGGKMLGLGAGIANATGIKEKIAKNPMVHKIKKIVKGKKAVEKEEAEKAETEELNKKNPHALVNLIKGGIGVGFRALMVATGRFDYNNMFHLDQLPLDSLPHKFAQIAEMAKGLDFNKIRLGVASLKLIPNFIMERIEEKKQEMPLVTKGTFKGMLKKIIGPKTKTIPPVVYNTTKEGIKNNALPEPQQELDENPVEVGGEI